MPRSVTVQKANTILSDGELHQVGEVVVLTDMQWAAINPALIPLTLTDNGAVPDPAQGPPGPPGEDGVGAASYFLFVQETPQAIWYIEHDLGYRPAGVFVEDTGGNQVEGDLSYPAVGIVMISFSASFAGHAYLS